MWTDLSQILPEIKAPTERSIRVIVIPQVTADGSSPNSLAISVVVIDTVKKSNATSSLSIRLCACLRMLSSELTIPRPASQANKEQIPLMRIELF